MEAIKCIMSRKSVRKYFQKEVPDKLIKKLLECAMQAPSAVNEQPWEFIVVRDKELLGKIPSVSRFAGMVPQASAAIIVCMNKKRENLFAKGYIEQDCSAATENILLAANALGLGAVWTGLHPNEKKVDGVRGLFGIPPHVTPLCIIPVGYPAEKKPAGKRFSEERIHKDRW